MTRTRVLALTLAALTLAGLGTAAALGSGDPASPATPATVAWTRTATTSVPDAGAVARLEDVAHLEDNGRGRDDRGRHGGDDRNDDRGRHRGADRNDRHGSDDAPGHDRFDDRGGDR